MKLRKKIGIGLGIIGIVSVGLGAGLQVYKECKKKNEDIEDISFEETPSERLENLEEELDEQMENSDNKLINKKDLVPFAMFSVGAVACFSAAYLLCCGDTKDNNEDNEDNEEKLNIEEFETDKEAEKVGDVEKGEEKEEFDFESALSKSTGKLEEIPLKDNTAELLYGKNNMYK